MAEQAKSVSPLSKRVFVNSAAVFFGQGVSLFLNLAVTVMLARHLGEKGFGIFSYGLVFVSFFALLADFGMKPIVIRELARNEWSRSTLLGNAIVIKAILSFFAIILAITAANLANFSYQLVTVITFFAINILITPKLSTLRIVFEAPFNADLEMHIPMALQFLDSLLLIGTTLLLISLQASLELIAIAYLLSNLPGAIITILLANKKVRFRFQVDWELNRFLLRQSLPIWFYTILVTLLAGVDIFILEHLKGEGAVGQYAAASRLTAPLLFIPHGIIVSLFPLFSRFHKESNQTFLQVFQLGFKAVILIGLALAIITTFLGDDMIALLYSGEYSETNLSLSILMWAMMFLFLNFYFIETLTSINQQKVTFYIAATMLLVNIPANLLFIPPFGITGAAYAKLISSAVGTVLALLFLTKKLSFSLVNHLPRLVFIGLFLMAICFYSSRLQLVLAILCILPGYLILVLVSGLFDQQERKLLYTLISNSMKSR